LGWCFCLDGAAYGGDGLTLGSVTSHAWAAVGKSDVPSVGFTFGNLTQHLGVWLAVQVDVVGGNFAAAYFLGFGYCDLVKVDDE